MWNTARIVIVALIVLATIEQAELASAAAASLGIDESIAVTRLFSFFTVQSNMIGAAVLLWASAQGLTTHRRADSALLAVALTAATTYLLITGLVYNVVLRSIGDAGIMLGWSNDVHHVLAPAFVLLDLLIAPRRTAVRWRAVAVILVYPLLWVTLTLVRGPQLISPSTGTTPWYPYPFLDPSTTSGGYGGVAAWVAGIAAVIAVLGALVIGCGRLRERRSRARRRPRRAW